MVVLHEHELTAREEIVHANQNRVPVESLHLERNHVLSAVVAPLLEELVHHHHHRDYQEQLVILLDLNEEVEDHPALRHYQCP